MLRRSGRKLFVATNSLWDYSNVVMNYVLEGKVGADKNDEWLRYFDVVIVGSAKPAFFTSKQPLFAVETKTGKLLNTDNGAPVIPIDEKDIPAAMGNTGPQLGQVGGLAADCRHACMLDACCSASHPLTPHVASPAYSCSAQRLHACPHHATATHQG
jgi:hypothetical protein